MTRNRVALRRENSYAEQLLSALANEVWKLIYYPVKSNGFYSRDCLLNSTNNTLRIILLLGLVRVGETEHELM